MTVTTAVCNAGHRIKIAHRKIQPEGCPVRYVLELAIEDVNGEDIHTINVFAKEPIEIYRASSESRTDILRSTKVLLEKGLLVRQTDEVSLEVAREYFPQPIEDEEDDEDYQVPTQYGQPGEGKTYTEEE
tara:strand:+ start:1176 stop:1565 length:390 start_codon:yes stop_codon:yes gene_type:complete